MASISPKRAVRHGEKHFPGHRAIHENPSALLNQKLSQFARSSASVVMAETSRDFDRSQDTSKDDSLPNADGAKQIAAMLTKAIQPLLAPHQDQSSK